MHAAVSGDKSQHIIQRMLIGVHAALQFQRQLIGILEHLPDIRFAEGRVDVGKLMVDGLHQLADRLVDSAGHILGMGLDRIRVDIDGRVFQALRQVQLRIGIALPHLHALGFLDGLIFGQLRGCVQAQELLNLQIDPDLIQKRRVIREHHQYFPPLPGHHTQCGVVVSALVPRCQNTESDIVILICLIGPVIHRLIEGEGIPAVKGRISVLLIRKNILEDHLGHFIDDFRHLHVLAVDLAVDLLLLVSKEDIKVSVLLYQHLLLQYFEGILHSSFQFDAVIINIADHERCNVVDVCLDLKYIFNHEQCLQHINGEYIRLLVLRIDLGVVIGADNDASVAVIQEILQSIIKQMERHNDAHLFVFQFGCRLLEKRQHGTFPFRKVLAGGAVCAD